MNKKCFRFFGTSLHAQEKWLNEMAKKGYRLIRVGKLLYEFEECAPGQVEYRVEFVGHKSKEDIRKYQKSLENGGCKVFYKNMNLNYSLGKMRYRAWAEKDGRIATKRSTYNQELLIVESENSSKPI